MKELTELKDILNQGINSDLDLEQALILHTKLRLIIKEYPAVIPERLKLLKMIQSYENSNL